MILLCRPKGRGNWRVITIQIDGISADLFNWKPNQVFELPMALHIPLVLRIVEVRP